MELLRPTTTALESVALEIDDKISSTLQPAGFTKERFLGLCHERLAATDIAAIENTLVYAESLPANDPNHPSMKAYFAHPLRVASFVLRLSNKPETETVLMGLIHNVFEVSGLTERDLLDAGFTRRLAEGIRLLTIERSRQYDPNYLTTFYRDIETFGEDLVLVKCVDRLDNLLAFDLIERNDTLSRYMDLTERFVIPMAYRLALDLGDYLLAVLTHMRKSVCNQELRRQHELFVNQVADLDHQRA